MGTIVIDLVTLALLSKLLWELGAQGLVSKQHFVLLAVALPFLLGLGQRPANAAATGRLGVGPVLRNGLSVVVLTLFVWNLQAQGVAPALAGLLITIALFYLFGRFVRLATRPLLSAAVVLIIAYLVYRYLSQ